jgi:D-alanyl-D-alanine dipeptidase
MPFICAQATGARAWMLRAAAAMMLVAMVQEVAAQGALPSGFVYLRDVDPSIAQDIRYAGSDNFVGRPLPGYEAAECILRRDVAAALKRVQAELAAAGLSLKVYDCYRPTRAVRAMAEWVNDGRSEAPTKRFFPRVPKTSLLRGYISSRSQHSTGTAIDLTLIKASGALAAPFDPAAAYGPCTAPLAAQPRQQPRHGHELRLFRFRQSHGEQGGRGRTAALAQRAGRGHAQAGIRKLRPRMVALFLRRLRPRLAVRFSDTGAIASRARCNRPAALYCRRSSDDSACFHFTDSPARKRANVSSSS